METVQTKGRQDVALYVSALELERPNEMFEVVRAKGPVEAEVVKEGEEQSFLSDKSILSFVADVSAQNRQDILNSTLLAQLAANKRTPIENNMKEWYKAYIDVLGNIGWVTQNVEINEYETRDNLFEVENVIVDILSASFGAGYITLIKKTLDSLKKMSEKNDGKIKVFEKNTQSMSKGCFQIGVASEKDGAVALRLGTFLLSSKNKITRIFFIGFKKDETRLEYASTEATLHSEMYALAAREAILNKLKPDITNYIAAIDI